MDEIKRLLDKGDSLMMKGAELFKGGSTDQGGDLFDEAIVIYDDVIAKLHHVKANQPVKLQHCYSPYYNIAIARTLQGRIDEALDSFERLLSAGFDIWAHLLREKDFIPIQQEPRYKSILRLAKSAQQLRSHYYPFLEEKRAAFPYDLETTTVEGERLALSELQGKVVLVHYFAPQQLKATSGLEMLAAIQRMFHNRVTVVGLVPKDEENDPETAAAIRRARDTQGLRFPIAWTPEGAEVQSNPALVSLPATIFIDKAGRVRFHGGPDLYVDDLWIVTRLLDLEEPT